ncbi:MAG: adenylate/guanylate cyclase domain-containing protein, partial [Hyphomonadaceae bacterium]|nr:adenylate/guanylate cyclase domain-containing protein [Hyphomonadaceae bacterium]
MSEEIARRLVTIAAVDAVGFSRQSEIDETAAVRQIQALHERVEAGAADHSGRVFNTAGDGFMLEFPTASGALQFAETLLETARVPLRIGIHMGEVFEAAGGDLLGRGVNVAARLRELAAPGEVLVSGETKRALPTPGGDRLVSRGATRLSKMDEKVEMFSLAGSWRGHLPQTVWTERLRDKRLWIAAAVSGAVLIIGAFAIPGLIRNENERVAVLEFETASDATLTDFAAELSDQIVGALAAGDLQAIPPASSSDFRAAGLGVSARRVGAGFVLDGNVRVDGDDTRVTMHIVDARTNVTLWSGEYRRATVEQSPMQDQLAAHVADVLRCALVSRRPRAGEIDPDTLAIFLRACDRMQRFDQGPEVLYEAARQVTDRAPRFARGWSMLAMACALASTRSPPDQAEDFRRQAREAAARAQAIDPRNAESALALAMILPPHEWRARQELIERALSNEPNSADANIFQGNF